MCQVYSYPRAFVLVVPSAWNSVPPDLCITDPLLYGLCLKVTFSGRTSLTTLSSWQALPIPQGSIPLLHVGLSWSKRWKSVEYRGESRFEERGENQPWYSFNKASFIQMKNSASTYYTPRCPESAWSVPPPVTVPGCRLSRKGCEPGKVDLWLRLTLKDLTGAGCLLTALPQPTFLDRPHGWSICLFTTHLICLKSLPST